jgi:5-methylcytosine-specific restriction endonuclease McrA
MPERKKAKRQYLKHSHSKKTHPLTNFQPQGCSTLRPFFISKTANIRQVRGIVIRKYIKIDRRYCFERQKGVCFFCGKPLKMGTLSIDHYLPRTAGGTDDVFNLVASCKACNSVKLDQIPEDLEFRQIQWFIQGYDDHHILAKSSLDIPSETLTQWIHEIQKAYPSGHFTVFESPGHRFYVRQNQIEKVIGFHHTELFE